MNHTEASVWQSCLDADFHSSPFISNATTSRRSTSSQIAFPAIQIDGRKCMYASILFDEWSRKCHFADYFGRNWDAFRDCMTDLDCSLGFRTTTLVVAIADPGKIMSLYPNRYKAVFWEILVDVKRLFAEGPNGQVFGIPKMDLIYVLASADAEEQTELLGYLKSQGYTVGTGFPNPSELVFLDAFASPW